MEMWQWWWRENNRNVALVVVVEGNGVKKILHFIHEIKTIAYDVT